MTKKLITIECTQEEFYAFMMFKKSIDRTAVVFKERCGCEREFVAILNKPEAFEKVNKLMEEREKKHLKEVSALEKELADQMVKNEAQAKHIAELKYVPQPTVCEKEIYGANYIPWYKQMFK